MIRRLIFASTLALILFPQVLSSAGQTRFTEYFEALPVFWDKIYPKGGRTLYCGKKFGAYRGRGINIEHVFPMSWATRAEGCRSRKQCRKSSARFNQIESDMHNFYPSRTDINKIRSSFPFAEISGERRDFGRCDFEFHNRKRVVEPKPSSRGNIARAMFYMHQTYDLPLYKKQGQLLKQWHRQDPPDRAERKRNQLIEKHQGNRNPFIDNPNRVNQLPF
jgi:deoxyribonuclease-1